MEQVWWSRLRWRRRGAWMWPAFVALTVIDAVLLGELPPAGDGTSLVPALLVCGAINLVTVAVAAPLAGWLVRRRRADLPRVVATDYAGTALLAAVTLGFVAGGLVHRPAVDRDARDLRSQSAAARAFLLATAPRRVTARLGSADVLRLDDRFYRTCVPEPDPHRAYCVFVRTTRDPPVVRADPDRTPNGRYRQYAP